LAFVPVQERGLDVWIVNLIRAIYTPTQRIWRKEIVVPAAFTYESVNVVKQEMITLAPTSSRRKLEEFLKYTDDEENKDPLDIPEKDYIMKVKEAFVEKPMEIDNVPPGTGLGTVAPPIPGKPGQDKEEDIPTFSTVPTPAPTPDIPVIDVGTLEEQQPAVASPQVPIDMGTPPVVPQEAGVLEGDQAVPQLKFEQPKSIDYFDQQTVPQPIAQPIESVSPLDVSSGLSEEVPAVETPKESTTESKGIFGSITSKLFSKKGREAAVKQPAAGGTTQFEVGQLSPSQPDVEAMGSTSSDVRPAPGQGQGDVPSLEDIWEGKI
jgi:hypothetical protein